MKFLIIWKSVCLWNDNNDSRSFYEPLNESYFINIWSIKKHWIALQKKSYGKQIKWLIVDGIHLGMPLHKQ